jgi:hypothetical protein
MPNKYTPRPYHGPITFFRATGNIENKDPFRGWKQLALGGMEFFDFECEHETMVEDVEVAKKLNEVLKNKVKGTHK